ncbi:hypothetical protein [uncultured Thiodictyon sp.]|uniref:hypothetical protein n=1 Tax=uncultured Thiodictyon sp. TaxID=1846217 RepID=UPI0025EB0272|nr:hypothetical protein [uncultured Thiodictyon sp.]
MGLTAGGSGLRVGRTLLGFREGPAALHAVTEKLSVIWGATRRQYGLASATGCAQHNNGNPALCQILLIAEVLIGGDQDIKAMMLCLLQQFSVRQVAPAQLVRGGNLMIGR